MCHALYLFTDKEIQERKFNKKNPCMFIWNVPPKERKTFSWLTGKRNVYYTGSSQGCGCGWGAWDDELDDDSEKLEKQKDRESLFKLLTDLEDAHLIFCWKGDEAKKLEREEILDIAKLKDITFEFEDCVDYILKPLSNV